jgi:nuclear GTP-binding protein
VKLLGTETFGDAFGPKSTRKRPRLQANDYDAMVEKAAEVAGTHLEKAELDSAENLKTGINEGVRSEVRDNMFLKGQSKRIWGELFKVLDSSDVVIQVSNGLTSGASWVWWD